MIQFQIPAAYSFSKDEIARSQKLTDRLKQQIEKAGGAISFAEYMQTVLITPDLGFYTSDTLPIGKKGAFITAPESSLLFGQCLAEQCHQVLKSLDRGAILELGAGSGALALQILLALEQQNCLPDHYAILEISEPLKKKQRALFLEKAPHLLDKVIWREKIPPQFEGIIVANEYLDVLPVHRFGVDEAGFYECAVALLNDQFIWKKNRLSGGPLYETLMQLQQRVIFQNSFQSEICLEVPNISHALATCLQKGVVLFIDYGYSETEYYYPARHHGTLRTYCQHLAGEDPFIAPGLLDVTAHVNFTQVATAFVLAGCKLAGYTHQASFLIGCGLENFFQRAYESATLCEKTILSQQMKHLIMTEEMGETVKVIGFTKNFDAQLQGFKMHDLIGAL